MFYFGVGRGTGGFKFSGGERPFFFLKMLYLMGRVGRVGRVGWVGRKSKVSFNFLHTLWVYRSCIYLLIYILKSCQQHCYGFQNLMSSWGSGSKFSSLQQVGDFSILGSKSVTFYFFLFFLWGFKIWCSKVSFNVLHTLWEFRTCIYILKYILKNCH